MKNVTKNRPYPSEIEYYMDNQLMDYCAAIDALDPAGELVLIWEEAGLCSNTC